MSRPIRRCRRSMSSRRARPFCAVWRSTSACCPTTCSATRRRPSPAAARSTGGASLDRSTPNRMWRRDNGDGTTSDIWGTRRRATGLYEEFAGWPLQGAERASDLDRFAWPEPDWWDFSPLPELVRRLDGHGEYHLRFRIGSVFELAWQLRGMQELLLDLVTNPEIPRSIMARLTDVHVENTRRVLDLVGDRIDLVYFLRRRRDAELADDLARHVARPIRTAPRPPGRARAVARGVPVMYHCDGAIYPADPRSDRPGHRRAQSHPARRERHGRAPPQGRVRRPARVPRRRSTSSRRFPAARLPAWRTRCAGCVDVLGQGGGFVMCSSHHIQPDTPLENVLAMYDVDLRYRSEP